MSKGGERKLHTDCESHDQKEAAEHALEFSGLPNRFATGVFVASLPCPCALVAWVGPVAVREACVMSSLNWTCGRRSGSGYVGSIFLHREWSPTLSHPYSDPFIAKR